MINTTILHGKMLEDNQIPRIIPGKVNIILPGIFNGQRQSITISDDILSRHLLLLGGTGCGKTNVMYHFVKQIRSQMTSDDVLIVFDTKGDFYASFYQPGDYVIANSRQYDPVAQKWNIYKEILIDGFGAEEVGANTYEITRSLFSEAIEKSTQPFFPNAARDILAAILIATIRMGEKDMEFRRKYFNNQTLRDYLDGLTAGKLSQLLSMPNFRDLSSVLAYIGDGQSDQSLGVMAELQSVTRQILVGAFARDGRFSIRETVRTKDAKAVFIEYDLSVGSYLIPIYRLLFDLALKESMGRNKSAGNVYLICDEFKLLPNLQHIEDGINFGRSLGVKIIAGLQSIEQMVEAYGESRGKNIVAGFSSVFSFRTNDMRSRQFVSELYGTNIVSDQYTNADRKIVEEKRSGHTVEDWELSNLKVGEAVVGLSFENPFRFYFEKYRG